MTPAPDPALISVPNQPLVTPVVAPQQDPVSRMIEAFRSGVITAGDIIDRTSKVSAVSDQAKVQAAREMLDPNAIAARQLATQAAGAQAKAELELMPQATAAKRMTLMAQEQPWFKDSIEALSRNGMPPVTKTRINPDTGAEEDTDEVDLHATAHRGANVLRAERMLSWATTGLTGTKEVNKDPKTGQEVVTYRNSAGENITPVSDPVTGQEKNPIRLEYQKARREAQRLIFETQDEPAPQVIKRGSGATPLGKTTVDIPVTKKESVFADPNLSAGGAISASIPAGPIAGTTAKEIQDRKDTNPLYKEWLEKKSVAETFEGNAQKILSIPKEDRMSGKVNMNPYDSLLSTTIRQIMVPSATGGATSRGLSEMQLAQIEEHSPWIESVKNWKQLLLKTGRLNDEERESLINIGRAANAVRAKSARQVLEGAIEQAKPAGGIPLYEYEQDLLKNKAAASPDYSTLSPSGETVLRAQDVSAGQRVTLSDGKVVERGADGKFRIPAAQ
jgi:hypothetical protein